VRAAMEVDRVDHILGVERLAVMKCNTLADLEDPTHGIRTLPALSELWNQVAVRKDFDQLIANRHADDPLHLLGERPGIEGVVRTTTGHCQTELAPLSRRVGSRHARGQKQSGSSAGGQEIAPGKR